MAYFSFRYFNAAREPVYESHFTLFEFIPIVRDVLRSLAQEPELVADPTGYRVFIRPCYETDLPDTTAAGGPIGAAAAPLPPPIEEGSLLQISEEDLEIYAPVSFVDEIDAFYNPGTSTLCPPCPDRARCPGSGAAAGSDLNGWIAIDPESVRSNERVTYFVLRVETTAGRVLRTTSVNLSKLRFYASMALTVLREAGRPGLTGSELAEIFVHFEGRPQIDPHLVPGRRSRATFRLVPTPTMARREPPRRLVDWDGMDGTASPPDPQRPDPVDLEIKVFRTQSEPLPHRPPPAKAKPFRGTRVDPEQLQIFVHRGAFDDLNAQRVKVRAEVGGILVGEAVLDPVNGRPYVEVVAALAATSASGEQMRVNLDSHFLRQVQERIDREFPGRRTIGWYQFHFMRVALDTRGSMVTANIVGEPLRLFEDELFLHRNFFPEGWHLGLVIDAAKGALRFYHLRNGEMAVSGNCHLVE